MHVFMENSQRHLPPDKLGKVRAYEKVEIEGKNPKERKERNERRLEFVRERFCWGARRSYKHSNDSKKRHRRYSHAGNSILTLFFPRLTVLSRYKDGEKAEARESKERVRERKRIASKTKGKELRDSFIYIGVHVDVAVHVCKLH